jgi:hypothetical protein
MSKPEKRLLLVIIAFLCGVIAGIVAGGLLSEGDARKAVLYGFGAFAGTTLFVLKIESALGLFQSPEQPGELQAITSGPHRGCLRLALISGIPSFSIGDRG